MLIYFYVEGYRRLDLVGRTVSMNFYVEGYWRLDLVGRTVSLKAMCIDYSKDYLEGIKHKIMSIRNVTYRKLQNLSFLIDISSY